MASTVRDVMSPDCQCIGENYSLSDAAKRLAELDVGAMPICGEDDKLKGLLTDRDMCGIVSQADLATNIDEEKVGDLVEAISAAP